MNADTVTHQEYSGNKGERYDVTIPKDSDILRGDGLFVDETSKNVDFTAKKGERVEPIKQGSSDIWKVQLRMPKKLLRVILIFL